MANSDASVDKGQGYRLTSVSICGTGNVTTSGGQSVGWRGGGRRVTTDVCLYIGHEQTLSTNTPSPFREATKSDGRWRLHVHALESIVLDTAKGRSAACGERPPSPSPSPSPSISHTNFPPVLALYFLSKSTAALCGCYLALTPPLFPVSAGSPSRGGDVAVYVFFPHRPTELALSFFFYSCVHFCLYGPFNCI